MKRKKQIVHDVTITFLIFVPLDSTYLMELKLIHCPVPSLNFSLWSCDRDPRSQGLKMSPIKPLLNRQKSPGFIRCPRKKWNADFLYFVSRNSKIFHLQPIQYFPPKRMTPGSAKSWWSAPRHMHRLHAGLIYRGASRQRRLNLHANEKMHYISRHRGL